LNWKSPKIAMAMRLLLTAACLAVLAHWWQDRPPLNGKGWDWKWAFIALGFSPGILAIRAQKWRACLRGLTPWPGWLECLRSYLGALPLAAVTPGRAGELARPLYFKSPALKHLETSGRLLFDNWTDTLAVLICTLPGCLWLFGGWGLAIGLLSLGLLAWVPGWLRLVKGLIGRMRGEGWLGRGREVLQKLLPPAEAASPRLLLEGVLWGAIAYALEALQFLALLRALGESEVAFIPLFSGLALIHLANSIQVTIAGIGPREGMTIWLLGKLGLSEGALLGASFLQTALVFLLPTAIGLFIRPLAPEAEGQSDA
jgi:uncharacterized membrane protein YbhN (UPF0104 family)